MAEQTKTTNNEELMKCGHCKKTVKPAKRYYRNGKYYCNKNCWTKAKHGEVAEVQAEGAKKA